MMIPPTMKMRAAVMTVTTSLPHSLLRPVLVSEVGMLAVVVVGARGRGGVFTVVEVVVSVEVYGVLVVLVVGVVVLSLLSSYLLDGRRRLMLSRQLSTSLLSFLDRQKCCPQPACNLIFFNQLFGTSLLPDIVMATNLNAVAKSPPAAIVADDPYATSDRNWHVTNVEEMRAMGISENPEYKDFWCADHVLRNMFVPSTMPRLRYEKLCQYLHCSVVENEDGGDRLAKVRPLITLCDRQFKACYIPNQNVSVDEAMIRFDGRLGWKQYMPKKPVKLGMKIWCLCDSETGYCSAFSIYTGATGNPNDGLDLGYRVVMNLMHPYLSSNRHVFADNYFTSVHLAKALLEADTYLCGTTRRTRREFPNTLAAIPLRSGESAKWTTDDNLVMLCKWHDKRDVYMIKP